MNEGVPKGIRELVVGFAAVVGSVATAVGAVLGILHQTGYWEARVPSKPAAVVAHPESVVVAAPEAQAPASAAQIAPNEPRAAVEPGAAKATPAIAPPAIALDGAWRDKAGYCHVLKQSGRKVQLANFAPVTNAFISAGRGTVSGRSVRLHMNNLRPAFANAELYLSDDGLKLLGTIHRLDGDHPVEWLRVGPNCG
jgi:hypothetical protein